MADVKTFATDETIALIKAKANDKDHGDNFLIKINRKKGVAGFAGGAELVATLGSANVEQIVNSETWLPKLVGGGTYIVRVYSEADHGKQLGGDLIHQFAGEPKIVDPNTLRQPGWKGPTDLRYPETSPQAPLPYMALGNVMQLPAQSPQPTTAPSSANTIPLGPSPMELELKEQLRQTQQILQQQAAALAQRDRELSDERAQRRDEQLRREQATAMAALESKLDRMANAAPVKSPIDAIAPLVTAVMPLVQSMITSSAETRQIMLKSQQDNQAQFQAIMLKSMERPTVPPEITTLMDRFQGQLDKLRETDPAQKNVVMQMSDAFSGMTGMMVELMTKVAESGLLGEKQEPMGMLIVKEIAKMVEAFGRVSATAGKGGQRALPARQAQVRRQSTPASAAAIGPQQPVAQPQPSNGLAGTVSLLDDIERRIRAEEDPSMVAAALIVAMGDVNVKAEIEEAGGFMEVFRGRLGDDWGAEHLEYAQALLQEIQARMAAAGITTVDDSPSESETSEN